jgi:GNAT superfamily N-acetyltransferase
MAITVRPRTAQDAAWVTEFLTEQAGSPRQVARGHVHQADGLPGFVAMEGEDRVGLATYVIRGNECEVATMHVSKRYRGAGSALMEAVSAHARKMGCSRLWLVTTNDNVDALRFYQRRGLRLVAVHPGAVDEARSTLKPEIPETGEYGIPLRDELELELML